MYDCWQCGQKSVTYSDVAQVTDLNYEKLCIIIPQMIERGLVKKQDDNYFYSLTLKSFWLIWKNKIFLKGF
jgi:predicted transcriptional regulator